MRSVTGTGLVDFDALASRAPRQPTPRADELSTPEPSPGTTYPLPPAVMRPSPGDSAR